MIKFINELNVVDNFKINYDKIAINNVFSLRFSHDSKS